MNENVNNQKITAPPIRGVSQNSDTKWQIQFWKDNKKPYFASVDNIYKASVIYDILSIQSNGIAAKTNLNYSRKELYAILNLPSFL